MHLAGIACKGVDFLPVHLPLALSRSLSLTIDVKKLSVGESQVVSTSSSSSAQLDREQPKAELQRGATVGNTA